jgi:hypothetical protein
MIWKWPVLEEFLQYLGLASWLVELLLFRIFYCIDEHHDHYRLPSELVGVRKALGAKKQLSPFNSSIENPTRIGQMGGVELFWDLSGLV